MPLNLNIPPSFYTHLLANPLILDDICILSFSGSKITMMRKLILLFMLATAPLLWLDAQNNPPAIAAPGNEIVWQLDSLIPCHNFQPLAFSKYSRDSLNKYNYRPDSLPPCSSDLIAQRLKDIGSPLDLSYNSDVQAFINLYTLQRREQVERMLGLAHVYFPIFDEVLDREGVPMEIRYLPIVESALNPHARSRVGATGLWQFMLSTGNMYNLNVTSYIDERRDPYKSTEAAIRYLKNMYKTYGDWLLVVAAYNCGPGNVNKAIARSGGKHTFWEIQEFLPRETKSYVPALIAATYVFNYSTEHNLFPRMVDFSYGQDTVQIVRQQMSLKHFADVTHTDFWTLKDLNPELKLDIIPYSPVPYVLRVPMKTGQFFAAFRDSIMTLATKLNVDSAKVAYSDARLSPLTNKPYVAEASENPTYGSQSSGSSSKNLVYHKVRRGEVVGSIASRYHVSAKDISKWNGLHNYSIKVGQSLKIYTKGGPTSQPQPKPIPLELPKQVVATATPVDGGGDEDDAAMPNMKPVVIPESKPVVIPESKPIAKVEPKPESKPVVIPESKPVVIPESKPIAKVEPKPESKPVVIPESKPIAKVEPKPESKPVVIPESKPVVIPESKPIAKVEPKPESKPVVIPESKPIAKVEPKPVVAPEAKPTVKVAPKEDIGARYHVVKQGDTLWQIANSEGLTVDKLISMNELAGHKLEIGQKLRVK